MSNYLAIATVTAAIHHLLYEGIKNDVPGAHVTHQPPDIAISGPSKDILNLFLYHVTENVAYRNIDLPARSSDGTIIKRPQLGLNLHYIITALAAEVDDAKEMKAHQILASAMRILHENPMLTRKRITDTINQWPGSVLAGSDLANQIEINITPESLSLEEITKLWSSFFQTNYRISATYKVTVVILDSILYSRPSLPVLTPQIKTITFSRPVIEQIQPQILEFSPGAIITVIGRNFQADNLTVEVGGIPTTPTQSNITYNKITLSIPINLTAGIKTVQVVLNTDSEHKGIESNTLPFVLAPKIMTTGPIVVAHGDNLTLDVQPVPDQKQQVSFLIGDYELPLRQGELSVTIPTSMPTGKALLRVRVDGADSLLQNDSHGQFYLPAIEVT